MKCTTDAVGSRPCGGSAARTSAPTRSELAAAVLRCLVLAASFLVLCLGAYDAACDEPEQALCVSIVDASGRPVKSGWIELFQCGSRINANALPREQWFGPDFLLRPLEARAGIIRPSVHQLQGGRLKVALLDGSSAVWIEVQRPVTVDGSDVGPAVFGPIEVPVKKGLALRLKAPATISGVVASDAALPGGLRVLATPLRAHYQEVLPYYTGSAHAAASVAKDGSYELAKLGAGKYVLELEAGKGIVLPMPLIVATRPGETSVAPALALESPSSARLKVVDEGKQPISGARIVISFVGPDGVARVLHREGPYPGLFTSDKGEVLVPNLARKREYHLRVEPPRAKPELGVLELKDWQPKSGVQTLQLPANGQ